MPFIHTISYIPSARLYIFSQQNIKHLRSDIADIVHILAAQIPKRLRFSVRARKKNGSVFLSSQSQPLGISLPNK